MFAFNAENGETFRISGADRLRSQWTAEDDQVLLARTEGEPWDRTASRLRGEHTAIECKRRLKRLLKHANAAREAFRDALDTDHQPKTEPAVHPLDGVDAMGLVRAACYWTDRMWSEPAALRTCRASYQLLAFAAIVVGRSGLAPPEDLYARWSAPVVEVARREALRHPAPAAAVLRCIEEYAEWVRQDEGL